MCRECIREDEELNSKIELTKKKEHFICKQINLIIFELRFSFFHSLFDQTQSLLNLLVSMSHMKSLKKPFKFSNRRHQTSFSILNDIYKIYMSFPSPHPLSPLPQKNNIFCKLIMCVCALNCIYVEENLR